MKKNNILLSNPPANGLFSQLKDQFYRIWPSFTEFFAKDGKKWSPICRTAFKGYYLFALRGLDDGYFFLMIGKKMRSGLTTPSKVRCPCTLKPILKTAIKTTNKRFSKILGVCRPDLASINSKCDVFRIRTHSLTPIGCIKGAVQ